MNRYPPLNYQGPDWSLFETWLQQEQMDCFKKMAQTQSEADTNLLRGRAQFIELLLDFKKFAAEDGPQPLL